MREQLHGVQKVKDEVVKAGKEIMFTRSYARDFSAWLIGVSGVSELLTHSIEWNGAEENLNAFNESHPEFYTMALAHTIKNPHYKDVIDAYFSVPEHLKLAKTNAQKALDGLVVTPDSVVYRKLENLSGNSWDTSIQIRKLEKKI